MRFSRLMTGRVSNMLDCSTIKGHPAEVDTPPDSRAKELPVGGRATKLQISEAARLFLSPFRIA
jgi:hypothetical protein